MALFYLTLAVVLFLTLFHIDIKLRRSRGVSLRGNHCPEAAAAVWLQTSDKATDDDGLLLASESPSACLCP